MQGLDLKEIQASGICKTNAELIRLLLLYHLQGSEDPLGSWVLNDRLNRIGVKTSLATVGRILKVLDEEGLTLQGNGRGRFITPAGKQFFEDKLEEMRKTKLNNRLLNSVKIASIKQLLDLFTARIIIETEVVKMATQAATQNNLHFLRDIVEQADGCLADIPRITELNAQFHTEIARITDNQFLMSSVDILMNEQWAIETDHHQMLEDYDNAANGHYHRMILDAMQQRDPEKAAKRMRKHLEALRDIAVKSLRSKDP